jgi:hypothetical protein
MDGNNKNNFRLDPLPPCLAGVQVSIVRVNSVLLASVRVIIAGFMTNALRLEHTICSGLVRYCPGVWHRLWSWHDCQQV